MTDKVILCKHNKILKHGICVTEVVDKGWMSEGLVSESGYRQEFFSSPHCQEWFWVPLSLLSSGCRE
jgi:hypothetical protein